MQRPLLLLATLAAAAAAGCGADGGTARGEERASNRERADAVARAPDRPSRGPAVGAAGDDQGKAAPGAIAPQDVRAVPIGRDPRFKPGAGAPTGATVAGLRCGAVAADRFGVHLELFAAGRVVVVPAGIGVVAPRQDGAYVRGGRCRYAVSTTEPTGVLEVAHGTRATLGDLFALWGQPLTRTRIASFRGRVRAWVGGRRVPGDPRAIPLTLHAQVVLAVGPRVPVHSAFAFRAGL